MNNQIIKSRDDPTPVLLEDSDSESPGPRSFKCSESSSCTWSDLEESFGPKRLRERIEPWLTALVQSEHLSLLVGSGLTHAAYSLATQETLPGMALFPFRKLEEAITTEMDRSAKAAGRGSGNVEDQIRVASELLRGLEIVASVKPEEANVRKLADSLREDLKSALLSFAHSILQGEHQLVSADTQARERAFNYLVSFLMSFASRAGTRERLQIFTTNYDRYLEAAADVAGLRLIDRFVGALAPVFRASRMDVDLHYNPPGIRGEPRYLEGVARFSKLHGSVDWLECDSAIRRFALPFGAADISPFLSTPGLSGSDPMQLMIYPNAAKDRETASYPYVELFRDLAASICRPNSTLVSYGYSFGDEHINRVIEDMLTIPSTHLVVIAYSDPLERIMKMYEQLGRHAQITLLIGDHLGDLRALVENYLPKPAIDRATFRMAELLKARWGTEHAGDRKDDTHSGDQGDRMS